MITAVETDILLDILVPNEQFYEASADALEKAASEGSIVLAISPLRSSAFTSKPSGTAVHSSKAMRFVRRP
jgi:hypothetical protein